MDQQAVFKQRSESTAKNFASVTTPQRELGIRQAVERKNESTAADIDGILASAKTPKERSHLTSVYNGLLLEQDAQQGVDGTAISLAGGKTAMELAQIGNPTALGTMASTSFGSAMKDPEGQRAKVINTSGNVVEIQADRSLGPLMFTGTLMTDGGGFLRFICPFATDNINAGTYARFRGVLVQEYDYPNVAGGTTKSLLAVGAFNQ